MIPSSAVFQRRSISRVKCAASLAEWITSRVSSLVWAAAGDQLKLPVITFRLSITANLWWSLSPRASRGVPTPCVCSGFEGSALGCSDLSWVHKPEPKPGGQWISCRDALGLRRATGVMDLAWLLGSVSPKPESHARERDVEEATQSEGQQQCYPSQVEAGWA